MDESADMREVWYIRAWGTSYVIIGVVVSLIFITGAVLLKDYSLLLYLFFSVTLAYMGLVRLRKPYLAYGTNQILVRGAYGEIYKNYTWNESDRLEVKDKRIVLNGRRLHFNGWFTNHYQYDQMLRFFSGENRLEDELQD